MKAEYVTPFLDENVMMTIPGDPDVDYYYYHDGLGSVRNVYDASETSKNAYDYYAFGKPLTWSETVVNRYTYTGREWNSESGTYGYRVRELFPTLGRTLRLLRRRAARAWSRSPLALVAPWGAEGWLLSLRGLLPRTPRIPLLEVRLILQRHSSLCFG